MKRIIGFVLFMLAATACSVHEWPVMPEKVDVVLKLDYETDMTIWEWNYEYGNLAEQGLADTYDNSRSSGQIRYVIRTYPITSKSRSMSDYTQEFVFTKDIATGYDNEVTLSIIPGEYELMVWSDLIQEDGLEHFYNTLNFDEIKLEGDYKGNDDYRDAFRGKTQMEVVSDYVEKTPETISITMQRPLAKYEFYSDDLQEFIDEELQYLSKMAQTKGEEIPTRVNTADYKVIIFYPGYMPNTFNVRTDKPVDSTVGIQFESQINVTNENEASLGFDYVFVNGAEAGVTVQIGLYAKDDNRQVALSNPITVPLIRSHHTVLRGSFLTQKASGGLVIDPSFDGNHNIVIQ